MLWWEAVYAKAERKGQTSCVLETESRLNSKAGLRSHGAEGMGAVGGLPRSPWQRCVRKRLRKLRELGCAAARARAGGIWLVPKEGCGSRTELDPAGADSNLHVTFCSILKGERDTQPLLRWVVDWGAGGTGTQPLYIFSLGSQRSRRNACLLGTSWEPARPVSRLRVCGRP